VIRSGSKFVYETFDHTADLGLRVTAPDLNALFAEAGKGLFSLVVEDLATVCEVTESEFHISGTDREYLLFDWLRELLYRFDGEGQLFCRFAVEVRPDGLSAKGWGEALEPARHLLSHEVKAITYHGLRVQQLGGEWVAEVIVDI
jgi:SHS2 domain-containing protein